MSILFPGFPGGRAGLGLLVLRVIAGAGMAQHGWGKIRKPFEWMGADSGVPAFLQALAAVSEFGGGIAIAIGLLTPIAAFGILCTMATATFGVHMRMGDPWVASAAGQGSYELALLYLGVAALLVLAGPGSISLDRILFGAKPASEPVPA
jgi:putative oxidoreductase